MVKNQSNNNLWIVIGVAVVVAVIASVVTVSLSGSVIKVPTTVSTAQTSVYSSAEVDNKIIAVGRDTQTAVLKTLTASEIAAGSIIKTDSFNCGTKCSEKIGLNGNHMICIFGFVYGKDSTGVNYAKIQTCNSILSGSYSGGYYACYCAPSQT